MDLYSIILAAGEGKRMKSAHAKPLQKAGGKTLVDWVLDAAAGAGANQNIVVIGHCAQEMQTYLGDRVIYTYQYEQLGTGHAVMQGIEPIKDKSGTVMVLCGDTPLITAETLGGAMKAHNESGRAVTVITAEVENPFGYGRIVRENGALARITEQKDATEEEKQIREINSGMYLFDIQKLVSALERLDNNNVQGEYYLTDVIAILLADGEQGDTYLADPEEILGVNDRLQLAEADTLLNRRKVRQLMADGVCVLQPDSVRVDADVKVGRDTVIYPGTILEGDTQIGEAFIIGPNTRLKDCTIGDETEIAHLTYVGDADVGERVNFGCGTVVVTYDGVSKHRTVIEDDCFIGCNSNLVSPVTVRKGAYTAAGSTITDEVPEDALAIARARQVNKDGWVTKNRRKD